MAALKEYKNTLGVAPTGSGKTVMLSAIAGRLNDTGKQHALIIQHRDELTTQNRATFAAVNPDAGRTGVIDGTRKEFGFDTTFGMIQTLARNLDRLKPVDLVIVDEAHHIAAKSYKDTIYRLRDLNPEVMIQGMTATPQRGDSKSLRSAFDNVADQIMLEELIRTGVLVKPRTFVIDLGIQEELAAVRKTISDFDMSAVADLMDRTPLNTAVVEHWKEKAGDRQTVVFCSTVDHATHVLDAFEDAGVAASMVTGETPSNDRKRILADFEAQKSQVLVNVAVLTEGWDCPPVGCVVLLRPCSYKSTMIQMIGRGLRRLDPEKYPGQTKTDCIVLDFGTSVLTHGSLEQTVSLEEIETGEGMKKECPECEAIVPFGVHECPICGYMFEAIEEGTEGGEPSEHMEDFVLTEIDLFNQSPFKWETLFDGAVLLANGFEASGIVVWFGGTWHAIGLKKGGPIRHLAIGEKLVCLSTADDHIREHETSDSAGKSRRWLHLNATPKQLQYLRLTEMQAVGINRYRASCLLTWKFNEQKVQTKLEAPRNLAA